MLSEPLVSYIVQLTTIIRPCSFASLPFDSFYLVKTSIGLAEELVNQVGMILYELGTVIQISLLKSYSYVKEW